MYAAIAACRLIVSDRDEAVVKVVKEEKRGAIPLFLLVRLKTMAYSLARLLVGIARWMSVHLCIFCSVQCAMLRHRVCLLLLCRIFQHTQI